MLYTGAQNQCRKQYKQYSTEIETSRKNQRKEKQGNYYYHQTYKDPIWLERNRKRTRKDKPRKGLNLQEVKKKQKQANYQKIHDY